MTAEIAIMNRFGVALAADSAATVSYWQNGERLTRYLKGANKIFNISTSHPVGAMIYDAGSLQGMPWEIVLKAYRDSAASKANDLLEGYAKDLFDFIVTNGHLFPQAYQDRQLIEALADVIGRITYVITRPRGDSGRQSRIPRTSSRSTIASNFRYLSRLILTHPFIKGIDHADLIAKCMPFKGDVLKVSMRDPDFTAATPVVPADDIFDLATNAIFRPEWTTLQTSGLVLSGFGETEFFPKLLYYTCYGIVLGTLLLEEADPARLSIDADNVSEIAPMAISDMAETFMYGAGKAFLARIEQLATEIVVRFRVIWKPPVTFSQV